MMNKSHAREESQKDVLRQPCARWFAAFGESVPSDPIGFDCRLVTGVGRSRKLYLGNKIGGALPLSAEGFGYGVIFDGAL